jgi:hypothetical protein
MENRVAVFGMNSSFAVRQFLPEAPAAWQQRGFGAVVAASQPAEPAAFQTPFPGVEFRRVPMKCKIPILSDILGLCCLWFLLRSIRPALANMGISKKGLPGRAWGGAARSGRHRRPNVVSRKVAGAIDIVQDGLTGILAAPGDEPVLSGALGRLPDQPETAARMARAARNMLREVFDHSFYPARLGEMIERPAAADRAEARRQLIEEARRL